MEKTWFYRGKSLEDLNHSELLEICKEALKQVEFWKELHSSAIEMHEVFNKARKAGKL